MKPYQQARTGVKALRVGDGVREPRGEAGGGRFDSLLAEHAMTPLTEREMRMKLMPENGVPHAFQLLLTDFLRKQKALRSHKDWRSVWIASSSQATTWGPRVAGATCCRTPFFSRHTYNQESQREDAMHTHLLLQNACASWGHDDNQ